MHTFLFGCELADVSLVVPHCPMNCGTCETARQRCCGRDQTMTSLKCCMTMAHAEPPNAKVIDRRQPTMTLNLSLSESSGSRSLHRLVGKFYLNPTTETSNSWMMRMTREDRSLRANSKNS